MKIAVIGIGQCGCNIADEFWNLNNYTGFFGKKADIVTDALAINTDTTDLRSFRHIPEKNRILVGMSRVHGHGVGKVNAEAARIFSGDHAVLAEEISASRKFYEADAVVVIASAAGGTGSGGIGHVVNIIKTRLRKKVIAIVVLPFAFEEEGDMTYALTNSATCLRTVEDYADVVFLLDNDRFGRASGVSMSQSFKNINSEMVRNFYDLFCAGEERSIRLIGSKVTDAGDIMASLSGISVIGRSEFPLPTFNFKKHSLDETIRKATSTTTALVEAINRLSTDIDFNSARKVLAMLSAPIDYITQQSLQEIYHYLLSISTKAEIRIGDYPRRDRNVAVTLIASEFTIIPRLDNLYKRAIKSMKKQVEIRDKTSIEIATRKSKYLDIPTLI